MITTKDVHGPQTPDETDKTVLTLVANNGSKSCFSLFSLNLKAVPEKVELHERVYEREGSTLVFNEVENPKYAPLAQTDEPVRPVRKTSKKV